MKIQIEVTEEIELYNYLDDDMVRELMDEFDIKGLPDEFDNIDFDNLSMNDNSKIDLFLSKFNTVPLDELETFLNRY